MIEIPDNLVVFGLDLGKTTDPSALVVLEREGAPPAQYTARGLKRWQLNTPYQLIIKEVARRIQHPLLGQKERILVVDATGVGQPVLEMIVEEGLNPIGVTITSGLQVTKVKPRPCLVSADREPVDVPEPPGTGGWHYNVPKRDLVSVVQMALQSRRMEFAAGSGMEHRETMEKELMKFQIKVTKKGNDTYEAWRESDHDDMVLALAVGLWVAEYEFPVSSRPLRKPKPIEERPLGG